VTESPPVSPHETIPPGENEAIERVRALVLEKLSADYGSVRPVLRGQHPKSHGCVKAEFVVDPEVGSDLDWGLFSQPRTYAAWIRFSASSGPPKPDSKHDAHGMSIKVLADEGEQDFCLVNHNVFFCRNAFDYADFAEAITAGGAEGGGFLRVGLFFSPPTEERRRGLLNLLRVISKRVVNPLHIQYWSQTPFALGPHAVKYSARPHRQQGGGRQSLLGNDGLEEAMARSLRGAGAGFDFTVQRQVDPRTMPVEDPTVEWKESDSPFRKVATIRIPPQDFASQDDRSFAESLFFTPWHALPDHLPLGGINRVRRAVYVASSALRHDMNGMSPPSARAARAAFSAGERA
jgi:Catalase